MNCFKKIKWWTVIINGVLILLFAGCKKDDATPALNWSPLLRNQEVVSIVAVNNNIFAGTNKGVFLSTNNGISWIAQNVDLIALTSLAASGTNLYASTPLGVFLSI